MANNQGHKPSLSLVDIELSAVSVKSKFIEVYKESDNSASTPSSYIFFMEKPHPNTME